jgi:hypothetical protein
VLLLVALIFGFLHTSPSRAYVLTKVRAALESRGIVIQAGSLDYDFLTGQFTLSNLQLNSTAAPNLPGFLRADRVSVDLSLRDLLRGRYRIESATILNPRIRIVTDEEGRSNLPATGSGAGASPPATIHAFFELARKHGIALLLDETYKDFLPEGTRPHELFSDPTWHGTLVHLYSFSKVFALTGYRVGGVTAGAALIAEIEKAMDCVSICPPRLGQEAALYGLRNLLPWARKNTEGLKARADLLGSGLARSNRWRLVSIGAYFAYVEHPFAGERSTVVSKRLADEENLLTIPGDMFGAGQERFVRIAFANVSDDKIPAVLERLERFGA